MLMSFVRFTTRGQVRYLVLCAICGAWMTLTITRIAFLAAVVALLAVGAVSAVVTRQTRVLIAAVIVGALLAVPFAPLVLERSLGFVPTAGELISLLSNPRALYLSMNWEGREAFWAVVFNAYRASPVLGLGMGASSSILRLHFPSFAAPVVHNDYLRLLSEAGIIGAFLFTCALAAWWVATVRAARVADRTVKEYALPAIGCIAALTVIGMTDNAFDYYGPFTQYLGFLCGGAIAAAASARAATPTTAVEQPPIVLQRAPLEERFRR
jgi:O-antigen ligase